MAKDFEQMENSNPSANPTFHEISSLSRRTLLKGGLGATVTGLFAPIGLSAIGGCASMGGTSGGATLGFASVPMNNLDTVTVPPGYRVQVLYRWGDAVGVAGKMPGYKPDASNTAAEQELQAGMHHDGIHYFPLDGNRRGLLAMNHEYTDDGLLHVGGMQNWSAAKVAKSQAAHGVSIIEIAQKGDGQWDVVRPSQYARRITSNTPMFLSGPAAGHAMLKTKDDMTGRIALGTVNNCAHGVTPWGTYLTCEENFNGYFNGADTPDARQARWGIRKGGAGYRWHEFDERFDLTKVPNEYNRFGWVVEIDPMDPDSMPVKRTALGRAAHEGACVVQTKDKRAVVYMGEDARFEYIYKFVSRDAVKPGGAKANKDLLDHGTLYVAKFNADGKGEWIELTHGKNGLTAANGFSDQAEIVISTRQASDRVGATKMDRPEWITNDKDGWIYCTLTNNSNRGVGNNPGVDAANPRANNTMGQIIRWRDSGDFDGRSFEWNHFVMAGVPSLARPEAKGNVKGDDFGSPDGLWADSRGVLWIQTDISTSVLGKDDYASIPNNAMLAADIATGEIRRFLVGPRGCELTGCIATPDMKSMFVNIQHPGETASERSDPNNPTAISSWPDNARPRSATLVITKIDGGVIGT